MKALFIAAAALFARRSPSPRPPAQTLNVFACEPEWGALATEIGGDKVSVYTATTGVPGPAPSAGAPEPDRARAHRRPHRLHRRRAGGRLAADDRAAVRPTRSRSRASPASFDATGYVRLLETPAQRRPRAGRHPCRRQSAHPDRSAQHAAGRARRWPPASQQLDPANAATYRARAGRLRSNAGARRIARWAAQAAPLRGVPDRRAAPAPGSIWKTGSACASGAARAEARRAAVQRLSRPGAGACCRSSRRGWCIRAAYEDGRALRIRRPDAPASRRSTLPFTVGGTDQAKDLFRLYDDTIDRCCRDRAMNAGQPRTQHPLPGVSRRPAGARHPRAARPAGARPRHRLYRPRDRPGRGSRRHRRRARWASKPQGWRGAGRRRRRGADRRAAADLDREDWPEVQEALIGVLFVARGLRRAAAARQQPARRRAPEGPAGRPDPLGSSQH